MKLEELKIICNALWVYKRHCTERRNEPAIDDYRDVWELHTKYERKLNNKTKYWYLVIRWSWSWYSWQSNCDRWERRSRCKKISRSKFNYKSEYTQFFDDGTCNYWKVSFEYDKPEVKNTLGWYERRLRKQWLPV